MPDTLRGALREELGLRAVLGWLVVVAVYWLLFDDPFVQFGVVIGILGGIHLLQLLCDVYDLNSAVKFAGVGLFGLVGIGAIFVLESLSIFENASVTADRSALLILAITAGWMLLDGVQRIRHEGLYSDEEPPEPRDGHEIYQQYVTERIHRTLKDRTMTRRELYDELEADDAAVDRALETLDDRGLLSRDAGEIRAVSPPERGKPERIRGKLHAGARRVARPITLELGSSGTRESDGR